MSTLTKRNFLALGLGAAVLAAGGYAFLGKTATATAAAPYTHAFMSVDEMKANGGLIVDIRTPPEWAETGVIDGAELVTFDDPRAFWAKVGPELADGRDLILICRSGNRSENAARILASQIPNHVISVAGGMKQEIAQGYQPVAAN